MQRDTFLFLLWRLSLDDETTRAQDWKQDRFAAAKDFFELFN